MPKFTRSFKWSYQYLVYIVHPYNLIFGSLPYLFLLQKNQLDASVVHYVVFMCNNAVILLLLYANKVYIILLKPHHNTPHYIRQQQIIFMQRRVSSELQI